MMKVAPRRGPFGAVVAGVIAVVLLNGWFAFESIHALLESEYWLAHTWQVIGEVESIMGLVKDAETGVRGYLIARDPRFLNDFEVARKQLPQELDHLSEQVSDNAHQRPNVQFMQAVIEQRIAMLQGSVDARQTRGWDAAKAMVVSGNGLAEMTRLHDLADTMEAEERSLLTVRTKDAKRSGALAYFATGLASGLDLLLLVLVLRYLARERLLREASEEDAMRLKSANIEIARTSQEVKQLNDELENRVRQRTAELESTNRELEAFSYSVSHDLRAPLRTIDGFSLALQEDYTEAVDATGRDYIQRVRAGVQRMGGLIDALLQLSRITRAEITRQDVDMSALAERVATNLREENPGQVLTFSIAPGMRAHADPQLLQVALENLLGNAVKFSGRRAESQISLCFDEEHQAFRIADNGAGFDMHYASKLFNAFNRLHGDKDFKGSGIGLATVARVIGRHHGRIWAQSEVDHGAQFWFTLG